jgi:paraquat-inducible protein B
MTPHTMSHRRTLAITTIVLGLAGLTAAQSTDRAELARSLHQKIEQLHELRARRLAEQKAFEQQAAALDGQIDRLQRDIAPIEEPLKPQRQAVADLEKKIAEATAALAADSATMQSAAQSLASAAVQLRDRIADGIPYRRDERARRFDALSTSLRSSDAAVQIAALADFWTAVGEELRLANTTQMWNEPLAIEGGKKQVHAYQLRIGLVNQVYLTEDAQLAGRASMKPGDAWISVSPTAVRDVFDIARQQKATQLTTLPFALSGGAK